MKLNLSVYELWFWRISFIFLIFVSIINYNDNRQQDRLIFKSIDLIENSANTDTTTLQSLLNATEIDANQLKITTQIIERLGKIEKFINN